ncbi:MAG TPA: hypothetical protein VKX16_11910 [Chloroflexota bacterium]|nr:hypothetical protein [Chloroflexota bacterium]
MKRRLTLGLALPLTIGLIMIAGAMRSPLSHTFAAASTPPPPPTFIPTPIGGPPSPPTPTPTNTPIPPTPTATTAVPGVPARIVDKATLQHVGRTAVVRWHMTYNLGIKGFQIYSGKTLLTHSLIRAHHNPYYSARVPWKNNGHGYLLKVLLKYGHARVISIK